MEPLEFFRQFPAFREFSQRDLAKIAETFHRRLFVKGETVVEEHKEISHIGFIISGSAGLMIVDKRGKKIMSAKIGPGQFYGITDFLINGSSMTRLICRDSMTCYSQSIEHFQQLTNAHPVIKNFFYQISLNFLWNAYQVNFCPENKNSATTPELPGLTQNLKKAILYIDENYRNPISLEQVSQKCHMSRYYFSRIFKSRIGLSFKGYLNQKRIQAAKDMMLIPDMNITEICFNVGFNDLSHFSRVFHKSEGMLPSSYRQGLLNSKIAKKHEFSTKKTECFEV